MKKKNFFKHFVETLQARSLLGMLLLAPMGASAQVTIGSGDLPQATLDIVGTYPTDADKGKAFRLDDGNQAPGKILTCQDNGIGTWQSPVINQIRGVRGTVVNFPLSNSTDTFMKQSGAFITLPPGKWEVRVQMLLDIVDALPLNGVTANDYAWVRSTFSDSSTAEGAFYDIVTADLFDTVEISGRVCGPFPPDVSITYGNIFGSLVIENTSSAPKTYYYVVGWITSGSNFTEDEVVVRVRTDSTSSSITALPVM